MILKFEESLVFNISEVKKTDARQIVKSPVKLLIEKYVSMKLENESTKNIIKYVQHDETEYGPSGASVSCARPDDPVSSSQLESDVHVVSCAKPTVGGNKPSMVGVKRKKKVWGVKKNGLYGWKMVVVDKPTSTNIHTKKHNIQPTSNQKPTSESIPQQNNFEKWLVTPW